MGVIIQPSSLSNHPIQRATRMPPSIPSLMELTIKDPHRHTPLLEIGESIIEPWGAKTTRVFKQSDVGGDAGWAGYPTRQFKNINGDMYLVGNRVHLADSFEIPSEVKIWGSTYWSNRINNLIHGTFGTHLARWFVGDADYTTSMDFTSLLLPGHTSVSMAGEGKFTDDDRYVVVVSGGLSNTNHRAWSVDMGEDRLSPTIIGTRDWDLAGEGFNNIGFSPSGKYIVAKEGGVVGGGLIGLYRYDPDFSNKTKIAEYAGHFDRATGVDNRDVAILNNTDPTGLSPYHNWPTAIYLDDLSTVLIGKLDEQVPEGGTSCAHASGTAMYKPGYALLNRADVNAAYSFDSPTHMYLANMRPGELVSEPGGIHIGPTYYATENSIHPLGFTRAFGPEYTHEQPKPVVDRHGSSVMYGSKWYDSEETASTYITEF